MNDGARIKQGSLRARLRRRSFKSSTCPPGRPADERFISPRSPMNAGQEPRLFAGEDAALLSFSLMLLEMSWGRESQGLANRWGCHLTDDIGRMFLCARCRVQVVMCRRCDRGQFYRGLVCSRAARLERQRDAGRRYQCSVVGQAKHAERS